MNTWLRAGIITILVVIIRCEHFVVICCYKDKQCF